MLNLIRMSALSASLALGACAHGLAVPQNLGGIYIPVVSSCRTSGPNDACVTKDFHRCVALIDYANPGRDESTYTGIINGLTTIAGTALGYGWAGIGGEAFKNSMKVVGSEVGGGSVGTILTYDSPLYRSSVETCVNALGRDKHAVDDYFFSGAYTGGKVQSLDSVLLAPNQ